MTLPVKLKFDPATWDADLVRDGGQFEVDDGIETATMISLFSDRLAEEDDELPGNDTNRRGWWGDAYSEVQEDLSGSRLWLLHRSKTTQDVVNKARIYAQEALQWLLDDGVADQVIVTTDRVDSRILAINTEIWRTTDPTSRYSRLWEIKLDAIQ
jgi:phage gp46-like protein